MRFIHLADVHLGAAPDRGCPWSDRREKEIRESFRRVIDRIVHDPVDFLLIAGDLFHRPPLYKDLREVSYLFSRIPDTEVFLCAGNHDFAAGEKPWTGYDFGENVFCFSGEKPSVIEGEGGVFIYGLSYTKREIEKPLYDGIRPLSRKGIHILLAHGGDEKHIPIRIKELARAGFDYIALGHIHRPAILIPDRAAYCGALEPLDRNDTGPHGFIEGEIQGGKVSIRFVPFSRRRYEDLTLFVDSETTQGSLEDALLEELASRGEENIYRLLLEGRYDAGQVLYPERLLELCQVSELVDRTRPAYDLAKLQKRYAGTIVSDYIACFLARQESGRELTQMEQMAMDAGLAALLGDGAGP